MKLDCTLCDGTKETISIASNAEDTWGFFPAWSFSRWKVFIRNTFSKFRFHVFIFKIYTDIYIYIHIYIYHMYILHYHIGIIIYRQGRCSKSGKLHRSESRWLATPKRWRIVRGHDKLIHRSCTISFPGGIKWWILVLIYIYIYIDIFVCNIYIYIMASWEQEWRKEMVPSCI